MSNVTNVVVLSAASSQEWIMEPFLKHDPERDWQGAFGPITTGTHESAWINNGKAPECAAWVGAFNHLNRPALLRDLAALPWEEPAEIQVLICGQEDECFGLWMFQGTDLVEVPLPGITRIPLTAETGGPGEHYDVEVGLLRRDQEITP